MVATVKLLNVDKEFKKLLKDREKELKDNDKKTVDNLLEDLVNATPVDTGLARASWKVTESSKGFDLENNTEYIEYLNRGSSKQAPSNFIESIAIQYGTPKGAITETY